MLHTLPAAAKGKAKENGKSEASTSDGQDASQSRQGIDAKKSGLSASTTAIPRLITVVEIIKREYLAAMNAKRSPHLVGLFQYNEIGSLEDQAENEGEEEEGVDARTRMITEALSGSKQ